MSWFRRDGVQLHVLTIGKETFSADSRYSLAYHRPDNWRLRIRPALSRDNGTYLCQVSTHPPIILLSHLNVIGEDRNNNKGGLSGDALGASGGTCNIKRRRKKKALGLHRNSFFYYGEGNGSSC